MTPHPHLTHPITEAQFNALRAAQARAHIHADTPDVVVDGSGWSGPRTVIAARNGDAFFASEPDWHVRLQQREIDNYWAHLPRDAKELRDLAEALTDRQGTVTYETNDENDEQVTELLNEPELLAAGLTETHLYTIRKLIGLWGESRILITSATRKYAFRDLRSLALEQATQDEQRYEQACREISAAYAAMVGG